MPLPKYDVVDPDWPKSLTVTIPNGGAVSQLIDLGSGFLNRIVVPAAWTAADLTFQSTIDGGATWFDLYDEFGVEVTVKAAASRSIRLTPADWYSLRNLRLRSGPSAAPVNQAADRVITLVVLPRDR